MLLSSSILVASRPEEVEHDNIFLLTHIQLSYDIEQLRIIKIK